MCHCLVRRDGQNGAVLTPRRLTITVATLTIVVAVVTWLVIEQGGRTATGISGMDWESVRLAREIVGENKRLWEFTVMFGLRGIILTVFLPIFGWISRRRRTWWPVVGFLLVLLFETGLTGGLKIAVGREFPWQSWPRMGELEVGKLAYPSGHAANAPALWGYIAWWFTRPGSRVRKSAWLLVSLATIVTGVSSWLIRTHWPTDLVAGSALGVIALVTGIAFMDAAGASPWARTRQQPAIRP